MKRMFYAMALTLTMTGLAWAQSQNPLKITLSDALVDLPEGRKAERDSTGSLRSMPGDIVRYTLMAENTGAQSAHNIEVVDPIPFGTEYVAGSATGEGSAIFYSVDGGNTYSRQPMIDVRDEQGRVVRKPAPASMYTHVKWVITQPMQPREKRALQLMVRVQAN
jgi:uncharacterized repeat protein (TIGR01451 family)